MAANNLVYDYRETRKRLETGRCNISVISTDAEFELFKHFGFRSGRDVDKFDNTFDKSKYKESENGIPYITEGTNAYFSLEVKESVDLGSHTLKLSIDFTAQFMIIYYGIKHKER